MEERKAKTRRASAKWEPAETCREGSRPKVEEESGKRTHVGRRGTLDDEHVLVSDRLVNADANFLVCKLGALGRCQGNTKPGFVGSITSEKKQGARRGERRREKEQGKKSESQSESRQKAPVTKECPSLRQLSRRSINIMPSV